jgi:precorrin-6A/cobalt-precorrin-6A reductase
MRGNPLRIGRVNSILTVMGTGPNILLLAGSAEARQIAKSVQSRGGKVHALVSEAPRGANPMPVPFELLSFDDPVALAARMVGYDAVIDASHGFDGEMSHVGFEAANLTGLPFVTFARERWSLDESPKWSAAATVRDAMPLIAPLARVFSAAGWASLSDCAAFPGGRMFLRQTSRHDRKPPYPFVELVFGDAPFSVASEMALFDALRVDTLLCRNLGGLPSRPKLDAAKAMGLTVILIDPPGAPDGAKVLNDVADVMRWIDAL